MILAALSLYRFEIMEGSERCFLSDVPFLSVFLSDVTFLRIRCNWPLVAVLGGSGLDSGFLEFLGLDSDFRGPPGASGLDSVSLGPPWVSSANGYKRFSLLAVLDLFSSTSHKYGVHHKMLRCRRSNIKVRVSIRINNICTRIQRYQ